MLNVAAATAQIVCRSYPFTPWRRSIFVIPSEAEKSMKLFRRGDSQLILHWDQVVSQADTYVSPLKIATCEAKISCPNLTKRALTAPQSALILWFRWKRHSSNQGVRSTYIWDCKLDSILSRHDYRQPATAGRLKLWSGTGLSFFVVRSVRECWPWRSSGLVLWHLHTG